MTTCEGCGVCLPAYDGPTHAYALSSPACWKLHGEVLAREYSDKAYWVAHRLTVDAYAIQHPGNHDRRAIQSVATHLASLYLVFEEGKSYEETTKFMSPFIKYHKSRFTYFHRPASLGTLTILDVWKCENAEQHAERVKEWALCAWNAWIEHHAAIERLVKEVRRS